MSVTPIEPVAAHNFGKPDGNAAHARQQRLPAVAPRRSALRTLVEAAVTVVLVATLVRTWLVQAFTVDGSSMATTLVAEHVDIECPGCGFFFPAGLEGPASYVRRAVCANCGVAEGRIDTANASGGDLVLVDKTAFLWRRPRRWEVVSLRAPHDAGKVCAKRVVGLPGEAVSIIDGDVYVDGRIARKNLAEQRALAIAVHDDRFRPAAARMPPCWQSGENSKWTMTDRGFSFPNHSEKASPRSHGDTEGLLEGGTEKVLSSPLDVRLASLPQDWLTYHHVRLDNMGVAAESPVQDVYGYNQTLPVRELHVVRDLSLSFEIAAEGQGAIFSARHGRGARFSVLDRR